MREKKGSMLICELKREDRTIGFYKACGLDREYTLLGKEFDG